MSKKYKNSQKLDSSPPVPSVSWVFFLSQRGKKFLGIGVALVILGFFVLRLTDPAGQNWASTLSPLLLVSGYVLIGLGIVFPDPPPPSLPK